MGKMENGNKNRLQAANCGFNLKETEFKNENFNYNAMLQVFLFVALTKKKSLYSILKRTNKVQDIVLTCNKHMAGDFPVSTAVYLHRHQ